MSYTWPAWRKKAFERKLVARLVHRTFFAGVLALLFLGLFAALVVHLADLSKDFSTKWDQIEEGMSRAEIHAILGEPDARKLLWPPVPNPSIDLPTASTDTMPHISPKAHPSPADAGHPIWGILLLEIVEETYHHRDVNTGRVFSLYYDPRGQLLSKRITNLTELERSPSVDRSTY